MAEASATAPTHADAHTRTHTHTHTHTHSRELRSINEKPLTGEPSAALASMLHLVFGMDHYDGVNYCVKLPLETLSAAESALTHTLTQVRAAADAKRARMAACAAYMPREPLLHAPLDPAAVLHPELLRASQAASYPRPFLRCVCEVTPHIFGFPMLRPEACEMLLREAEAFLEFEARLPAETRSSTGFNRRHVVLEHMGLSDLPALLFKLLKPLVASLFPREAAGLDFQYSYIIGYGEKTRVAELVGPRPEDAEPSRLLVSRAGLRSHTDDSEITLNIGLGRSFTGGDLIFRGLRSSSHEGQEEARVKPEPGRAIVHLGQQLHEVADVSAGDRFALIMWCRSSAFRAGTCPCCLIHRRSEGCICDGTLN